MLRKQQTQESWSGYTHNKLKDFKTKKFTGEREGHFVMMKGSPHQEDRTIINIYVPNNRTPKYMK